MWERGWGSKTGRHFGLFIEKNLSDFDRKLNNIKNLIRTIFQRKNFLIQSLDILVDSLFHAQIFMK